MAAFLTVFRKTSSFQGPYEFFSGNDWEFSGSSGKTNRDFFYMH
jgi:hypothetical protein